MNANGHCGSVPQCRQKRIHQLTRLIIYASTIVVLATVALAVLARAESDAAGSLHSYFADEAGGTLVRRLAPGPGFSLALGDTSPEDVITRSICRSEPLKSDDGSKAERLVWTDPITGLEVAVLRRWRPQHRDGRPNLFGAVPFVLNEITITNRGKKPVSHIHSLHIGDWRFRNITPRERFRYEDLKYSTQTWYGSTFWTGPDWTRVGKDWHHSGQNVASVRVFTAPMAGKINIKGRVYKLDTKGGDGVSAAIRFYGVTLWKAEIDYADAKGAEPNITLNCRKGDLIRFALAKRGAITCDTTHWDPVIAYEGGETFQASKGFSNRQGANCWSYQMESEKPGADADLVLHFPQANFEENRKPIASGKSVNLNGAHNDGESSEDQSMPFFILADGADESGIIAAVGQMDGWQLKASRGSENRVRMEAIYTGNTNAELSLRPGEKVALPPVLFGCYSGAWTRGAAALRRFLSDTSEKPSGREFAEIVRTRSRRVSAKLSPDAKGRMISFANLFFPASLLQCHIGSLSPVRDWTSSDSNFHSLLGSAFIIPKDIKGRRPEMAARVKAFQAFHSKIRRLLSQTYHRPLPLPKDNRSWDAQQFQSYDADEGVLLVFRQNSELGEKTIRPMDLKREAWYSIKDAFGPDAAGRTGEQLMGEGLRIALPLNGSLVLHYRVEGEAPPPPSELIVKPDGPHALKLSWTAVESASGYVIWRDGDVIARVENLTNYRDAGLTPGRACRYAVAAERGFARSAPAKAFGRALPGAKVYLRDLTSKEHDEQPGAIVKAAFKIAGKEYKRSLGMTPGRRASYELGSRYKSFTATVGIDDESKDDEARAIFEVVGDGKLLLRTKPLIKDKSQRISVDVRGVEELTITTALFKEGKRESGKVRKWELDEQSLARRSSPYRSDGLLALRYMIVWGDALLEPDPDIPKINSTRPELHLWELVEEDWRAQDKITESSDSYARATANALKQGGALLVKLHESATARVGRGSPATGEGSKVRKRESEKVRGRETDNPSSAQRDSVEQDDFLAQAFKELEYLAARRAVLARRGDEAGLDAWRALYLQARWLKRRIALSNPLLDFDKLLFVKRVPTSYSHLVMQYFGWRARPGGGIFVLEQPGRSLKARDILDGKLASGNVLSPCLSWSAQKIVFSYTKCTPDDPYYHIYEVNVGGAGLRQLTYGEYEDLMPAYLPDGGIVFSSTRRKGYARCFGGQFGDRWHVFTLHRMDADGRDIQTLSFHETNEWFPTAMPNGLILYSRWDYVDRHPVVHQNLWLTRSDGTNPVALYGNYTESPNCSFQTQPIPGSHKIVFTASAHHSITAGSIAILDPRIDVDGQQPIERITPEVPFPEAEGRPQTYYAAPWPLSEDYFLVAYSYKPLIFEPAPNDANALGLYLLDRFGNKELIYRDPEIGCTNPIPLRPRPTPPVVPKLTPENANDTGEFVLFNVYQGLNGIPKGTIKALRIIQILPKATPVADVPPVGLAGQEPSRAALGTVPVEADGSAYFTAPARKPLLFQAIDERGMAVQTMRSITYLQPGERSSCIGCHERRTTTPANYSVKALLRDPSKIRPGPDGCVPFSYPRLVQPVLDKYCVKCHGDKDPEGNIALTGAPEGQFSRSYLSLMKGRTFYGNGTNEKNAVKELVPRYGGWNSLHTTRPGGAYGARGSRLMKLLLNDHYDVKLDGESIGRLAIWIDANSIFYGTYDAAEQVKQQRGELVAMPSLQ